MKKIVLCGNYGGINTGDEAILQGFLSVLKGKAHITVLSHNPQHTANAYQEYEIETAHVFPMGVKSMLKNTFNGEKNKTVRAIKNADLFILGGGSLFTDEESWRAPLNWHWQAKVAKRNNTKIIMFGQTVGPISSNYLRNLTAETFNWADEIYVRDAESQNFLNEIGIKKTSIKTGDCALLLNKHMANSDTKTPHNINGDVLFIPRDWPNGPNVSEIAKMLTQITKRKVKTLSLYRDLEKFEQDGGTEPSPQRSECIGPLKLIEEMQNSSLVVSMRLHGNILAAIAGTPFIPLSYSKKVNGFMKEVEYPVIFDWENFSQQELEKAVAKIIDPNSASQNTEALQKKIDTIATQTANYLNSLL